MIGRPVLFATVLTFVLSLGALSSFSARSAEPVQRLVRVGVVWPYSPTAASPDVRPFRERLRELGYIEGQNLLIEERWAEGRFERLPALTAEVLAHNVDVLVTYTTLGAAAAKKATTTTPIVAAWMGDPVGSGLVASLAHPGANLTGLSSGWGPEMAGKWLELLQEAVANLSTVAVIANPDQPIHRAMLKQLGTVVPARGLKHRVIDVRNAQQLDHAFELARRSAQAVLLLADPITIDNKIRVTTLATKHRLPAMYGPRDFVDVGGLMAYGPDLAIQFRRTADYADMVLKGTKPAELPIEQPTRYWFVINMRAAKVLGLTFPEAILLRADEIIQ